MCRVILRPSPASFVIALCSTLTGVCLLSTLLLLPVAGTADRTSDQQGRWDETGHDVTAKNTDFGATSSLSSTCNGTVSLNPYTQRPEGIVCVTSPSPGIESPHLHITSLLGRPRETFLVLVYRSDNNTHSRIVSDRCTIGADVVLGNL